VDLCKDRACTMPLGVTATIDDTGQRAVPDGDLPAGWVFWRVRVVRGSQMVTSATWQFWVGHPHSEAPIEVDASNGALLDVNGDGYVDFLVGAPAAGPPGVAGGTAHLYLGSPAPGAADWNGASPVRRLDLADPAGPHAFFGNAVASAGDVNGDGYADFLIGALAAGPVGASANGAAALYLGSEAPSAEVWNAQPSVRRIDLTDPDGPGATFGAPVVGLGDVNGDGYADFLIADSGFGLIQPFHVYFGSASPRAETWNDNAPRDRLDLSIPDGVQASFKSAAGLGDVNGDGFPDFAVATTGSDGNGAVHLYLGSASASAVGWNGDAASHRIDLASPDGAGGEFFWVAAAGDVNGDGYADLLVGASGVASKVGVAHLYLGARDPAAAWSGSAPAARIDLTSPDGTMNDFGSVVGSAGDVDGDGLSDLLISGFPENFGPTNAGLAYLYLGMKVPSAAAWNNPSPTRRIDLIAPQGPSSSFGSTSRTTGDINGDLRDDFAISATAANAQGGAVYIYLGGMAPTALGWNTPQPDRRVDVEGPDPKASLFGVLH
jgi:FG-GAP repeat protein